MNVNLTAPAFPCTPMKDQFNQWIVPNAGISKLEYFAFQIYCAKINNLIDDNPEIYIKNTSIDDAMELLELIEKRIKPTDNEKTSKLVSL